MALPTTTNRAVTGMMPSNAIVGLRENLSDMIRDVSPMGYSFLEMVKDGEPPNCRCLRVADGQEEGSQHCGRR